MWGGEGGGPRKNSSIRTDDKIRAFAPSTPHTPFSYRYLCLLLLYPVVPEILLLHFFGALCMVRPLFGNYFLLVPPGRGLTEHCPGLLVDACDPVEFALGALVNASRYPPSYRHLGEELLLIISLKKLFAGVSGLCTKEKSLFTAGHFPDAKKIGNLSEQTGIFLQSPVACVKDHYEYFNQR